jgi:hypothetical protein
VFGDKCNYAHGEVDVEVFRCHVCFTWVATGAW